MDEITEEPGTLTERVAALDIGKATLTACIRVPHERKPGARRQEVRTCATLTPALLELRDWLICQGRDPGGDGGHLGVLEAAVLPARGRHRLPGGQRPRRQERPRPPRNRPVNRTTGRYRSSED
jgi:hypothetical protein